MAKPLFFLCILIATIAVYWGAWHGYFQQDEWSGFGRVLYAQKHGYLSLVRFSGLHFTPLSISLVYVFYNIFGLNHAIYAWFGLFIHAINTFLVYILAKKMTRQNMAAGLSCLIFLTAFTPYQTITWYAASLSFLPSAFFALLALLSFESYLEKKKLALLIFSLTCVLLGAGFRENAAFLLAYFPLRAFLLSHPTRRIVFWYSLGIAVMYGAIRFIPLLFTSKLTSTAHVNQFQLGEIVLQGFIFLTLYLPRLLVPTPIPLEFARMIFGDQAGLARIAILTIFYIGVWIAGALLFFPVYKKIKNTPLLKTHVLSLGAFISLSIIPLSFFPKPFILESRHYYLTSVGTAILLGNIVIFALSKYSVSIKKIIIGAVFLIIGINVLLIRQEMGRIIKLSSTRVALVKTLTSMYPTLSKKTIIFSAGERLPFQSGVGQILMVIHNNKQDYTPFFDNKFLWGIEEQGYQEKNGIGFGYFDDFSSLLATYCQQTFNAGDVYAFSWDTKMETLRDVSSDIRPKLICAP